MTIPEAFEKLLKKTGLLKKLEAMAYTYHKEYVKWISEAKKQETKDRRMTKAIDMLKDGRKLS